MPPSQKYLDIKEMLQKSDLLSIREALNQTKAHEIMKEEDSDRRTLFYHAFFHPDEKFVIKVVDIMLQKGANPLQKDINQQNVLYYVAKDGKLELAQKLLTKFDYNINESDFMRQTPLFYAAKHNQLKIAELLIAHNYDVNHKDNINQTCLFYAARHQNLEMCKLLVAHGVNVFHQDKDKNKALNYAKMGESKAVIEYLKQFKHQSKKIKQDKRVEESNQTSKRKKKETFKNQYCLLYTNENGQVHQLTLEQLQQFKNTNIAYQKLFQMMEDPIKVQNQQNTEKRFEKAALKLVNYFWKLQNGHLFHQPVDYVKYNYTNYTKLIKYPMDFSSIKNKINFNAYQNQEEFKTDMNLVFDNCILFNGAQNLLGKIALEMKLQFNTIFLKEFYSV